MHYLEIGETNTKSYIDDNGKITAQDLMIKGDIQSSHDENKNIFTDTLANKAITIGGTDSTVKLQNILQVGGGYGNTGSTFATNGDGSLDGKLTVDGTSTLTGSVTFGGNIISDAPDEAKTIFNTITSQTISVGAVTSSTTYIILNAIKIGGDGAGYTGSTAGNTGATIEKSGNFKTDGTIRAHGTLTVDGTLDINSNIIAPQSANKEIFVKISGGTTDYTGAVTIGGSSSIIKVPKLDVGENVVVDGILMMV